MKRIALIILLALFTLSLVAAVTPTAHASTTSDYCVEPIEQEFLNLINNYRAANGLGSLTLSWTLSAAAQHHSLDIGNSIKNGTWDTTNITHTLSDGTTWYQNIVNHGYVYSGRGENIAWGYNTAQQVFDAWRNSPSHNYNMLYSSFKVMGIDRSLTAVSYNPTYPTWTNTFASIDDHTPPPVCGQTTTPTSSVTTAPTVFATPTPTRVPSPTPTSGPRDITPPTVSITSPADGATVIRKSKVTITATAADDMSVQRVDFSIGGKRKCSDSSTPYTCLWTVPNKPNTTYVLQATAYDNSGNSSSATVSVTSR